MEPDFENDRAVGPVSVGRGTYHGADCRFVTYLASELIHIGRYCSIADGVTIATGGNHRDELPSTWPFDNFLRGLPNPTRTYQTEHRRARDTVVGSDVWIGDHVHVGGGVHVGHGAVLGACAVVFKDVPPYAVVAGNPARVLRYRFSEEIVAALLRIEWWNWPPGLIRERLEWFYLPIEEFLRQAEEGGPA